MIAIVVEIEVAAGREEEFKEIAVENARASEEEEGCTQFTVVQSLTSPTKFGLFEQYVSAAAIDAHKKTPHFAEWLASTAPATGLIVAKTAGKFDVLG